MRRRSFLTVLLGGAALAPALPGLARAAGLSGWPVETGWIRSRDGARLRYTVQGEGVPLVLAFDRELPTTDYRLEFHGYRVYGLARRAGKSTFRQRVQDIRAMIRHASAAHEAKVALVAYGAGMAAGIRATVNNDRVFVLTTFWSADFRPRSHDSWPMPYLHLTQRDIHCRPGTECRSRFHDLHRWTTPTKEFRFEAQDGLSQHPGSRPVVRYMA